MRGIEGLGEADTGNANELSSSYEQEQKLVNKHNQLAFTTSTQEHQVRQTHVCRNIT